jgi:hypothetical protein
MTHPKTDTQSAIESKRPGMERRVAVRYLCNQTSSCHSIRPGETSVTEATIFDISIGGLSLVTDCPFEKGEILVIELENASEVLGRKLFARVQHAKQQSGAGWTIGCRFVKRLTEDELSALL